MVIAARDARQAIYPVSTGLNWGYGNADPVRPGARVMDLSAMRAIRERITPQSPVAVIEPGVTQADLHLHLQQHCPSLMFNVTGSAAATSIIGNALDRGVGYLGPRREDLFGLEVVTGAGQLMHTGFRRLGADSPLRHCHPYGLGPMLDGLFFQSNFGVVTSACFKLLPRPPRQVAVSLALRSQERLGEFIDVLAELKRERLMESVTHIGNKARTQASLQYGMSSYLQTECGLRGRHLELAVRRATERVAPHEWTSLGGVAGTSRQVAAALAEVRARVRGLARMTTVDDRKLALGHAVLHALRFLPWARANAAAIAAIKPLHGLAAGIPTDAAVDNLLWKFGQSDLSARQFAESSCGVLYISPALPMDGKFVAMFIKKMIDTAQRHKHQLYLTLNIETANTLVAVSNLLFDRTDPAAAASAQRCADALYGLIREHGLEVYRARTDMMAAVTEGSAEYWETVRELKRVLDPMGIISPGRYGRS